MKVINWKLAAHPVNWAIVFLMLILAGAAGALLMELAGVHYAAATSNPATTPKVVPISQTSETA